MGPPRRRPRRHPRGVALLLVVISIAILTAVATEFAYNSRVDLQLAANQRDEIRAEYQARSGIQLSRLVLRFQRQLDNIQIPASFSGMLQGLTPGLPGAAASGGTPAGQPAGGQSSGLNLQIWRMVHVDCHLLAMLSSDRGASATREGSLAQPSAGCFTSTISDEEERINLNRLDAPQLTSAPTVLTLMTILSDKRFEFLFSREDANRVKVTPQELLIAIKDWIDEDEVQSSLNLTGQGEVFLRGFSDENYNYDRYTPRYKAKNGRFDSLDELFMVHGVNDQVMAALRDRLTVYPDINRNVNINTEDPLLLYMAILAMADPSAPDPRLLQPAFIDLLMEKIRAAKVFSVLGLTVADFANILASAGMRVNRAILTNPANNRVVGDKSQTYRIKSVGEAGSVQKTLTAVVRLDDRLGTLLYWKEE